MAHPQDGDESGDGRPLGDACAPEELAQVVHLTEPVVEIELEVPVQVDREGRARCDAHLIGCHGREIAKALLFPVREHEDAGEEREHEHRAARPASRNEVRKHRADGEQVVRRLQSTCRSRDQACEGRLGQAVGPRERSTRSAASSTRAIEGKSGIAVRPSACGRNCSIHFS